jgi:hypothetical protein
MFMAAKHTVLGELIGRAAYTALQKELALSIDG